MPPSTGIVHSLTVDQTRALRLRAQRLDLRGDEKPVDVDHLLRSVCGVQAQDAFAARLAIRVRGTGLQVSDIDTALEETRTIVRTWCMRGTLHLLAADDVGWLLPLLAPSAIRKDKQRNSELGLSDETYHRAAPILRESLTDQGPLDREQLAHQLSGFGIPTEGQRIYHLLKRAALEGLICYGPEREGQPRWVVLEDWVRIGEALEPEVARAELARRYLKAFGPAGPEDFGIWSGLGVREARQAFATLEAELREMEIDGSPAWILAAQEAGLGESNQKTITVRLLGSFDPYLLGYRNRDLSVGSRFAKQVHPGGGIIRPTLLVDGRAIATWTRTKGRTKLAIELKPFAPLIDYMAARVEDEVQALGDFLGINTMLEISPPAT